MPNHDIPAGRPVLVTTEFRGVFVGVLSSEQDLNSRTVTLKAARMVIYWGTTEGLFELCERGPTHKSKISSYADIPALHQVTGVFDIAPAAWERWCQVGRTR